LFYLLDLTQPVLQALKLRGRGQLPLAQLVLLPF
jgi:hypothetical protein